MCPTQKNKFGHVIFWCLTKPTANSVIEQLKKGEDFAALAKELSTDTGSAANGGDLGLVRHWSDGSRI